MPERATPATPAAPAAPVAPVAPAASTETAPLSRGTGVLTVLLALAAWSSIPLFLRHFAGAIDTWTSNGWRYGFAALVWLPVILWAQWRGTRPRGIFRAALVPALTNSVGQVFYTWAHYKVDPGLLSFGLRTQILFIAACAYALFPAERWIVRAPAFWIGIALVIGGTAGTAFLGAGPVREGQMLGLLMAVLSGLFFGMYYVSVRWYLQPYPSLLSFAVVSQYTALAMVALMLLVGEGHGAAAAHLPRPEFTLLLVSAVIGIALGHTLYFVAIKRLGVAVAASVMQVQPVLVAAASFVIFGEVLHLAQWISGALAVSGALVILLIQRQPRDRRDRRPQPT